MHATKLKSLNEKALFGLITAIIALITAIFYHLIGEWKAWFPLVRHSLLTFNCLAWYLLRNRLQKSAHLVCLWIYICYVAFVFYFPFLERELK